MRSRAFMLAFSLLTTACTATAPPPPSSISKSGGGCVPSGNGLADGLLPLMGRYQFASAAWTPPPPVPNPPPQRPDILALPEPVLGTTGDPRADAYRARLLADYATGLGWRPYLVRLLAGVCADRSIAAGAEGPPRSAVDAVDRYLTPSRIREGRRLYREMQGKAPFQGEVKIPLEVLLAMWAVASDYGRSPPRYDMLQAQLMRGAYNQLGYPESFEIYGAARIILDGKFERNKALAYADGRVGQVRMLPGEYFRWAKDGDGDGRADIWRSRADILKTFHDLMIGIWNEGVPILVEIEKPTIDAKDPAQSRFAQALAGGQPIRPDDFKRVDGEAWPSDAWGGVPVTPFGGSGPTFLMNRNAWAVNLASPFRGRSDDFSGMDLPVAVGLLAEQIAGRPGPTRPIR